VSRLLLVRHARTIATRSRAFPADEPLDDAAVGLAARLLTGLPRISEAVCSPAVRARQTARAAGLSPRIDERLAECDFGSWAGRSLAEVHGEDPMAVQRWMTDPDARPHGGETLAEFSDRVAGWLESASVDTGGCVVAVTHGGVVRAATARVLGAPPWAMWQIDVEPLTITELHSQDGAWLVKRVNCPADAER
jgi:broad specificity phosphatase PhoE